MHTYMCIWYLYHILQVFVPKWLRDREYACQCRRCGFDPTDGKIPWRREWLPTLVFLPGKSHGQRSLVGYSSWGCKEPDRTEQLSAHIIVLFLVFGETSIWFPTVATSIYMSTNLITGFPFLHILTNICYL